MNKNGKFKVTGVGVGITVMVLLLIGIGVGLYSGWFSPASQTVIVRDNNLNTGATATGTQAGATCPDTLKNIGVRVKDNGAAIPGYLAGTVYIYDHESNELVANLTTVTGGSYTRTTSGLCGAYDAILVTTGGTSGSAMSTDITKYVNGVVVGFDNVDVTLDTNQLSYLEATIDFMDQPSGSRSGYLFANAGAVNQTTFTALNTTSVYTDAAQTAKAVGASGKLEAQITLRDNAIEKSFGDRRLKTALCMYVGTNNVWDTTTGISISLNNVKLNKISKNAYGVSDDTISYISNSQVCYAVPTSFDDNIRNTLDLSINARSGQNPSTSDDVSLYFLPQGVFKSTAGSTLDQALTGIATDASTQALAGTSAAYVPLLTIQVS